MPIVTAAADDPFLSTREIRDERGLTHIYTEATRRRLHEAGINSRITAQKTHLEEHHRQARRFSLTHGVESWNKGNWRAVVFTDEATFCSQWDQHKMSLPPREMPITFTGLTSDMFKATCLKLPATGRKELFSWSRALIPTLVALPPGARSGPMGNARALTPPQSSTH